MLHASCFMLHVHLLLVLRNKVVQLIVLLFAQDYLHGWQNFFSELFSYLSLGPPLVDIFLRICLTIHEELIARYVPKSDPQANLVTLIVKQNYFFPKDLKDLNSHSLPHFPTPK